MDPNVIGPATLSLTQTVATFFTFLPGLREVRKANQDDAELRADVRHGELSSTVIAVGVGAIISFLTKSPTPIYISIMIAFLLIVIYEITLRKDPNRV